ncbi:uncharacterized protein [Triticum aestivum]|uniref:uncharacterized protein n=1 Tax=Triticum aestivum TaxID=4565 RepID=UPI001D015DBB|nr:uncharacterized protein LOC123050780 [Triticum aestivum]
MSSSTNKNRKMVRLHSSDGEEFEVAEEAIGGASAIIKGMLEEEEDSMVATNKVIPLPVTGPILSRVLEYVNRHSDEDGALYRDAPTADDPLRRFDDQFVQVDQDTLFDLMAAANYLEMQGLLDLTCRTVADQMLGKTTDEIRTHFYIHNDYTADEEEEHTEWQLAMEKLEPAASGHLPMMETMGERGSMDSSDCGATSGWSMDVLHDILSRLSIRDVVRMSILSREWRQLRICHPDLVLTLDTFLARTQVLVVVVTNQKIETTEFITNVNNLLRPLWSTSTTSTTTLDKFVIEFCLRRNDKYHIDRWVNFGTASRAKHIALDFTEFTYFDSSCCKNMYIFPLCKFSGQNGSCVKSLNLGYVPRFTEAQSRFSNLRNLNMNLLDHYFDPEDTSWVLGLVDLLELTPLLAEMELHIIKNGPRCWLPEPKMVTAVQGPLHRHLRSVHMSGICHVLGLIELALYILGNATVLERMVINPVAHPNRLTDDIHSFSEPVSVDEWDNYYIDETRVIAKQHLDRDEFRHILTFL